MNSINQEKIKYIVIDDEIAINKEQREDFVEEINCDWAVPDFAGDCEDAIEKIKKDSEIKLCFLDCRLPLSSKTTDNNLEREAGISLISQIAAVRKNFPIIIYSAYVERTTLIEETSKYKNTENIVGYLEKDQSPEVFRQMFREAVKLIGLESLYSTSNQKISEPIETETIFSYESLDPETKDFVRERTEKIRKLIRRTSEDIYYLGKYLTEVKNSLDHGQFMPWLETEFGWGLSSAGRFMKVYKTFKLPNLGNLNIVPSALFELAHNAIPDNVREEVLEASQSGEPITYELAKSIKEEYKEKLAKFKQKSSYPKGKIVEEVDAKDAEAKPSSSNSNQNIDLQVSLTPTVGSSDSPSKQSIVKIIPRQRIWTLQSQQKHIVVCQEPESIEFQKLLPKEIGLALAFPNIRNWIFPNDLHRSCVQFYSEDTDMDSVSFIEAVQKAVETYTDADDNISIYYIPHPKILMLIENLGCNTFIVDPDHNKCLDLVNTSKKFFDEH